MQYIMEIQYIKKEMTKKIIALGGDLHVKNLNGESLLHIAARNNQIIPLIFLSKILYINDLDNFKQTPLIYTVKYNSKSCFEFLLRLRNIDLNAQDEEGNTALHLTVLNEEIFMVYKLLMKGARYNLKNKKGSNSYELSLKIENQFIKKLFV